MTKRCITHTIVPKLQPDVYNHTRLSTNSWEGIVILLFLVQFFLCRVILHCVVMISEMSEHIRE